jgi:hypothetical protein
MIVDCWFCRRDDRVCIAVRHAIDPLRPVPNLENRSWLVQCRRSDVEPKLSKCVPELARGTGCSCVRSSVSYGARADLNESGVCLVSEEESGLLRVDIYCRLPKQHLSRVRSLVENLRPQQLYGGY